MVKIRKSRGSYKTGNDNILSSVEIVEIVRERMTSNNPMKNPAQRERMRTNNSNPNTRAMLIDGVHFVSIAEACRHLNKTWWMIKKEHAVEIADSRPKTAVIFKYEDKFVTPVGTFKTKKEITQKAGIPEWTVNTIFNNLDSLPVLNGRSSKKIKYLNIDPSKTWRENGFSLLI